MDPLLKQILDPEALATLNRAIKAAPRPGASSDLQIAWLYEHHRALASEVVRLRAALAVVVEALQRTGTLDAERAVARMRELLVTGEEQTAVALTPVMDTPLMTPAKTAGPSAGQAGKKIGRAHV